jgi:AraC-like DNA-binding protein
MPGSTFSVFGEADDFQTALKAAGCVNLLVTGGMKYRARLSLIALHHMRLAAGDERQSRIAFVSIPSRFTRVTLPIGPPGSLICSGVAVNAEQIVTHSGGYRFHERTNGPCRWGTILLLTNDLFASGIAMNGSAFAIPPGECRWRPKPGALRCLVGLHRGAIAVTSTDLKLPVVHEAARGLEQQLLGSLMECMAGEPIDQGTPATRRSAEIMGQFEDALRTWMKEKPPLAEICSALGIPRKTLWRCCHAHLGMGPGRYLYLCRMRMANRALRDADRREASVAQIARLHGFDSRRSFSQAYRLLFNESPSVTLRRLMTE